MTMSDKVVSEARKDLGCSESPPGSNDGACVNRLQASTGAYNVAWCASAVSSWWKRAGIDVSRLATASTWQLVENGRILGLLRSKPVQGCAVVWRPGPTGHTEIFIKWVVPGVSAWTIGGNTGDAVREHIRDVQGAYFVVPPELERVAPAVYATKYGWEDVDAKPVAHGLYATTASREHAVDLWVNGNPRTGLKGHGNPGHVRRTTGTVWRGKPPRKVKRYSFLTGQRRLSIDFATRPARDQDLAKTKRQPDRSGHRFRTTSHKIRVS